MRERLARVVLAVGTLSWFQASRATGQELEPWIYSPSPVGTTFVAVGPGRTWGGVVTDPRLPVEDVNAKILAVGVGAGRTFNLAGRQALSKGGRADQGPS